MYKLFLDDLRSPPDETWVLVRSVAAAIRYIEQYGLPYLMSLDHDLGDGVDAPVLLRELINRFLDGVDGAAYQRLPSVMVRVHSANIVGSANLESIWDSFVRAYRC